MVRITRRRAPEDSAKTRADRAIRLTRVSPEATACQPDHYGWNVERSLNRRSGCRRPTCNRLVNADVRPGLAVLAHFVCGRCVFLHRCNRVYAVPEVAQHRGTGHARDG